jgi:hypothetical protein
VLPIFLQLVWNAATWSVVIAAGALVAAVAGLVIAWLSKDASQKSAREADRSATASERSAVASERSATAAEAGAELQKRALEVDQGRVARERLEYLQQRGPQWGAAESGEAGFFRSNAEAMHGQLRNTGLGTAKVTGAWLDCNGQRAVVHTRCDSNLGGGGWTSELYVPPGAVLELHCEIHRMGVEGAARPSLYMDFEQIGADTGQQGVTVTLLRKNSDAMGTALWEPTGFRPALLP